MNLNTYFNLPPKIIEHINKLWVSIIKSRKS